MVHKDKLELGKEKGKLNFSPMENVTVHFPNHQVHVLCPHVLQGVAGAVFSVLAGTEQI